MVTLLVSCSDYTRATCLSSFKFPETLFCDLSVGLTAHNDSQTCKVRCTFETLSSRQLAEDKADISDEYKSFTRREHYFVVKFAASPAQLLIWMARWDTFRVALGMDHLTIAPPPPPPLQTLRMKMLYHSRDPCRLRRKASSQNFFEDEIKELLRILKAANPAGRDLSQKVAIALHCNGGALWPTRDE